MGGELTNDGRNDFAFFHGRWSTRNVRLKHRFVRSNEWIEFHAESECFPIFSGFGNFDRMWLDGEDGTPFEGMTLRLFDPATGLWSLWWSDNRSYRLFSPVIGRFENGRGSFYGKDESDGRSVDVVFHWSDITATTATWEQAFSLDGGVTWETNWYMYSTRIS